MQMYQTKKNLNRLLTLVIGKQRVQKMRQLTILLVGVGGIGCEVLKSLTRMRVKKIVMIDLDVIEVSNLNRQFYFKQQHVGQPKVIVAAEQIKKLVQDDIQIEPIYGSIYESKFDNFMFYRQFDYVISALDSLKAREYLAKRCTQYGKMMIDGGTAGFYGQSYVSVRFLTGCHNCHSNGNDANEPIPVCTIRSRPQKTAHCAVYAKHIFTQLFTTQSSNSNHSQFSTLTTKNNTKHSIIAQINKYLIEKKGEKKQEQQQKQIANFGKQLFNYLFLEQYNELQESERQRINMLTYNKAILLDNTNSDKIMKHYEQPVSQQDTIWPIKQYTQQFMLSFIKLSHRLINIISKQHNKQQEQGQYHQNDPYDKDDSECNLFINCVCNLRVYNFMKYFNNIKNDIQDDSSRKIKYISLYECRRLVGNIIPAIASTNAIAAALQVKQIIEYLNQVKSQQTITHILPQLKYYTISPLTDNKLTTSWLGLPNPQCRVCSPRNIYFYIQCDLYKRTFTEFEEFANQNCFSQNRDVYCQNLILVKNIKATRQSANKKKVLGFKSQLVIEGTLTVEFFPVSGVSELMVKIVLINKDQKQRQQSELVIEGKKKFTILNKDEVENSIKALKKLKQYQQQNITITK